MAMEFQLARFKLPALQFNYDELKQAAIMKVAHYEGLVYDEKQVAEAKKDIAELRKIKKALNDARLSTKKEWLVPYEEFETKVKDVISVIDEPIDLIDAQLKEFDERRKQEKQEEIRTYFAESAIHPDWLRLEQIEDPRWMNVTFKIEEVKKAIEERCSQIRNDLQTLQMLEYAFEATETYKSSLDLNQAIAEGNRLLEMQKRKAAEEAARKEEEARKAREEASAPVPEPAPQSMAEAWQPVQEEEPQRVWIGFEAYMNVTEAKALGQYLKANGIAYRKPQK